MIEIVIALAIFATIAVITSTILYQSFQIRARVTTQSDRLTALQFALTLLQRDTEQLLPRAVRGNEMHLFPPFIGQTNYLEFTRAGAINPMHSEQRSTLKRIAYVCDKGRLIRRMWSQLDTPDRNDYHNTILLTHLSHCSFAYIGHDHTKESNWYRDPSHTNTANPVPLPQAVQLTLTLNDLGQMVLLFIIPGSLYGQ